MERDSIGRFVEGHHNLNIGRTWFKGGHKIRNTGKTYYKMGHPPTFFKHLEETKKRIALSMTGKFKGKKHTEQSRKNMSLGKIGKPSPFKGLKNRYSEKTLEKIRNARLKQDLLRR